MVGARRPGGIQGLRELAESYPDELVWELHQLRIDIDDIGGDDTPDRKAVDHVLVDRLLRVATRDTSSVLFAATHGWDFPVSREWVQMADFIDAFYAANSNGRRPKPYPRPWQDNNTSRLGKTDLSPAEAREVLRKNRG
ncbi:hypothetical protein ITJ50_00925 [Curtobacterium sp. VKM Ac-2889]|uniref:hypothetical protein n=1 Tax=unclassified Curtobacterium TaxID=257496 RepID=UPI00188BA3E1|nr:MULTISPECIES: hypothetical protein [unclassified Curtobacterium]MBF4597175.1 hypothetical protein [Curtobacterium sp. VKM Ac-1796]MBF4609781.1 hypothetical protein [Curtobacterium sp. VKM Ac-2889]